jgi:hypothetical protein
VWRAKGKGLAWPPVPMPACVRADERMACGCTSGQSVAAVGQLKAGRGSASAVQVRLFACDESLYFAQFGKTQWSFDTLPTCRDSRNG